MSALLRFFRRVLIGSFLVLYLSICSPTLAQSSANGLAQCARTPSCASQLGLPLKGPTVPFTTPAGLPFGVPTGMKPLLPLVPTGIPVLFWPTPTAGDDIMRKRLSKPPVGGYQNGGISSITYGTISGGNTRDVDWYILSPPDPTLTAPFKNTMRLTLGRCGLVETVQGVTSLAKGALVPGACATPTTRPIADQIPQNLQDALPAVTPDEVGDILDKPGNTGSEPISNSSPFVAPFPLVVAPADGITPPYTASPGQSIPISGAGAGSGSNPTTSPTTSPTASPTTSPTTSTGPTEFKDKWDAATNNIQAPPIGVVPTYALPTQNFLSHAMTVLSNKFPADFFGSYSGSPGVPQCPNYSFFGKTFEFCMISEFISILKYPAIISFATWAILAI
jgi:hypothetical protein